MKLIQFQNPCQRCLVEIRNDHAIDIERGRDQLSLVQLSHLLFRTRGRVDIHFCVLDAFFLQPWTRILAIRAPGRAVHHNAAVGQGGGQAGWFRLAGGCLGIDLPQGFAQLFVIRLVVDIVDIDIADDACLIDDEERPFGLAIGTQYAVLIRNRAMRPEIAEERKTDASQAFGPGLQTGDMVNADAQNLGIQSRELGFLSLVRRDLSASNGGERQGKECDDHVSAAQFAERDRRIQVAFEGEIGSGIADFQFHGDLLTQEKLI